MVDPHLAYAPADRLGVPRMSVGKAVYADRNLGHRKLVPHAHQPASETCGATYRNHSIDLYPIEDKGQPR
jgi:hypothetical protein